MLAGIQKAYIGGGLTMRGRGYVELIESVSKRCGKVLRVRD